jgi:hypothetical protein
LISEAAEFERDMRTILLPGQRLHELMTKNLIVHKRPSLGRAALQVQEQSFL